MNPEAEPAVRAWNSAEAPKELLRALSRFDATMLVIGNIIGVGIFTTTGFIARDLPSPGWILIVWAAAGLLSLAGALACGELSALMPRAGGDYVYLRETYGPLAGFLTGWTSFFITFSGSIAALAVGFFEYLRVFVPFLSAEQKVFDTSLVGFRSLSFNQLGAVATIIILSLVNYLGVRIGSRAQDLLTIAKVSAILGIVIFGFTSGRGDWQNFQPLFSGEVPQGFATAFGLALIPALFAYTGWNTSIYVASEVKNPQRNVPLSLAVGTLVTIGLYVAINAVYLYAVSIDAMKGVLRVAELASTSLFGAGAAGFIVALVAISILGSLNANVLAGPRIYYAMARDGVFFRRAAEVHPRYRTPGRSIALQALWSSALVLSGTFEQLLTYVMFAIFLFSTLMVGAVLVLRKSRPEAPRAYRTWGWPVTPLLFIAANLWIMGNTLVQRPLESMIGLGIVALGVPAYLGWRRRMVSARE